MSRQLRIENAMRNFYEKPISEQVISWYAKKYAQEMKPTGQCVICKSLKLPIGTSGRGATFTKHTDGRLTAVCGGRDGSEVCPGYEIMREPYVDRATITSEIRVAMRDLRSDLKTIRDRVLATGTFTKEDEDMFREMTGEYIKLKQIEDIHREELEEGPKQIIPVDDEILVPESYFGNVEGIVMKTPMLPTEKRTGALESGEYGERAMIVIESNDIPVYLKIDEAPDDE